MKLGLYMDILNDKSFTEALDYAAGLGLDAVEIGTGNFSAAPHCQLDELVKSQAARDEFLGAITERGLTLSALNCSGNLLDPHPERRQRCQQVYYDTVRVARELGLDIVITQSGCPGAPDGGTYPNWVTATWPAEYVECGLRQWAEEVTPFWSEAGRFAADHGMKIAIEMHHGMVAYNPRSLLQLRDIAGDLLGANLDPSHLWPQGMEPTVVVQGLAGCIWHVHAKDTGIDPNEAALNGLLEIRPWDQSFERSWAFRTVGYGHDELWWRQFFSALRKTGFDGVVSMEHEDRWMGRLEGLEKSVDFLRPLLLQDQQDVISPRA